MTALLPLTDTSGAAPATTKTRPPKPRVLDIVPLSTVIATVAARGNPGWLARPVWPADAYGVLSAVKKAGKTWLSLDLALSVASGTPWLGVFPCQKGPVLLFLGEGGSRKMLRRLYAIAAEKGVDVDELAAAGLIRWCERVPHLTNKHHLAAIAAEVAEYPPTLIIVDPLYLAARGAKDGSLTSMGETLEGIQHVAQRADAALVVVTHWNKRGEGTGSNRITGVGPAEWGRVLASAAVNARGVISTNRPNDTTVVELKIEFEGDEIPDATTVIRRTVWADDPDDLMSPLHYRVEIVEGGTSQPQTDETRVVDLVQSRPLELTKTEVVEQVGGNSRRVRAALDDLIARGELFLTPIERTMKDGRPRRCVVLGFAVHPRTANLLGDDQ